MNNTHNIPGATRRAVLLTKAEAHILQQLLIQEVDYVDLPPEWKAVYDRLEAVR